MTTTTSPPVHTHAEELRQRVAAGDTSVSAADLATAEMEERLAELRNDADRKRAREDEERAAAERVEANRAKVQQDWAAIHNESRQIALAELRTAALDAVAEWLSAAEQERKAWSDLTLRAEDAGFAAPTQHPDHLRNLLPGLARDLTAVSRKVMSSPETVTIETSSARSWT